MLAIIIIASVALHDCPNKTLNDQHTLIEKSMGQYYALTYVWLYMQYVMVYYVSQVYRFTIPNT